MKRLTSILAISVIAVMSAGAARADIASTTYVDNKVSPVSAKADTNAGEIATLNSGKQDKSAMVGSDSDKLDNVNNNTNYPTVAAVYTITTSALGGQVNNKLDKKFTGEANKNKAVITDDNGAITTGTISSAMITNGTIVNDDIAADAAIDQSKIAGLADSIADAKKAGTDANTALETYKTSNNAEVKAVKTTADNTAAAVNNDKTGLAATKKIADDNAAKLATMATSATVTELTTRVGTAETNITSLQNGKQNKLVSSGDDANISGSNGVTVTVGADGKIAVSGNQSAIDTAIADAKGAGTAATSALNEYKTSNNAAVAAKADTATVNAELAKKQNTLTAAQLKAVDSGITADKVTTYDGYDAKITAAQTKANNAVVANAAITAGTGTKITYDAKGLVTGSASLAASDIPTLATSKISGLDAALAGKIPVPSENNTKGKLVLTYDSDTKAYAWESIGR